MHAQLIRSIVMRHGSWRRVRFLKSSVTRVSIALTTCAFVPASLFGLLARFHQADDVCNCRCFLFTLFCFVRIQVSRAPSQCKLSSEGDCCLVARVDNKQGDVIEPLLMRVWTQSVCSFVCCACCDTHKQRSQSDLVPRIVLQDNFVRRETTLFGLLHQRFYDSLPYRCDQSSNPDYPSDGQLETRTCLGLLNETTPRATSR